MDYNDMLPLSGSAVANSESLTSDTFESGLLRFMSVEDMVKNLRPSQPVHCMHREAVVEPANLFLQHFRGHSLYAVKANPDPVILQWLYNAGIRHFDVASLGEVKL